MNEYPSYLNLNSDDGKSTHSKTTEYHAAASTTSRRRRRSPKNVPIRPTSRSRSRSAKNSDDNGTVHLSEGIQAVRDKDQWACVVKADEVHPRVLAEAMDTCTTWGWWSEFLSSEEESQQLTLPVETREYSGLKATVMGSNTKKRSQAMALGFVVAAVANGKLNHRCLPDVLQPMSCAAAALNDCSS